MIGGLSYRVQARGPFSVPARAPSFLLGLHRHYLRFSLHLSHPLLSCPGLSLVFQAPADAWRLRRHYVDRRRLIFTDTLQPGHFGPFGWWSLGIRWSLFTFSLFGAKCWVRVSTTRPAV